MFCVKDTPRCVRPPTLGPYNTMACGRAPAAAGAVVAAIVMAAVGRVVGGPTPACDMTPGAQAALFQSAMGPLGAAGYALHDTGVMKFSRGNAFGNNPSSEYGIYDWTGLDLPVTWMGPQDAWVWIGCTPPALKYFSVRSYLFSEPGPAVLFASLGDSNNILTFNTTAGGPCNRVRARGVVPLSCTSMVASTHTHTHTQAPPRTDTQRLPVKCRRRR